MIRGCQACFHGTKYPSSLQVEQISSTNSRFNRDVLPPATQIDLHFAGKLRVKIFLSWPNNRGDLGIRGPGVDADIFVAAGAES